MPPSTFRRVGRRAGRLARPGEPPGHRPPPPRPKGVLATRLPSCFGNLVALVHRRLAAPSSFPAVASARQSRKSPPLPPGDDDSSEDSGRFPQGARTPPGNRPIVSLEGGGLRLPSPHPVTSAVLVWASPKALPVSRDGKHVASSASIDTAALSMVDASNANAPTTGLPSTVLGSSAVPPSVDGPRRVRARIAGLRLVGTLYASTHHEICTRDVSCADNPEAAPR